MRTAIGTLSTAAALILAATTLGACGSNPADAYKTTAPATIANQAHAALVATKGIRLSGTALLGNETVTLDITSNSHGDATGTAAFGGSTMQVLILGGRLPRVYVKGDRASWSKLVPASAAALAGKWVLNVKPLPDILLKFTLPELVANEAKYAWEKSSPAFVGTSSINGESTVQISVKDKQSGDAEILDVSATEPHRVLRESEGDAFALTFDQFDTTVNVTAPAAADVVDLAKITAQK